MASPVLIPVMVLLYLQDRHSPFYIAERVGQGDLPFRMVKLRSMIPDADKSGVDSTSSGDARITPLGRFIRRHKLDEVSQLWNVIAGDMSLVGPRPNAQRETDLYTDREKPLLSVKPGITDISSIVFADEGEILRDSPDPDIDYNQLIRPWKSQLGLLYVENQSLGLDLLLLLLTVLALLSRPQALQGVQKILRRLSASQELIQVCRRQDPLTPHPPPGSHRIVTARTSE